MKLTKTQLKRIIKEELNELTAKDLQRMQHDSQRGIKKGHRITADITAYIRSLPDWEEYATAEITRADRRGEFAGEPEGHLMYIADEIYKAWGHKWEDHKDVIERRIGVLAEPHSYPSFASN